MKADAPNIHSECPGTSTAILLLLCVGNSLRLSHFTQIVSKYHPVSLTAYQGLAELRLFRVIFVGTHRWRRHAHTDMQVPSRIPTLLTPDSTVGNEGANTSLKNGSVFCLVWGRFLK